MFRGGGIHNIPVIGACYGEREGGQRRQVDEYDVVARAS